MTVQGWCPNHKSGGTERIATSGKTTRSAQLRDDEANPDDQNPEAFLLSGRRSASSQVRRSNTRLPRRAASSFLDHFATIKNFLSASVVLVASSSWARRAAAMGPVKTSGIQGI